MISRTKLKIALEKALDEKSPKDENNERHIITYPMKDFRHALKPIADDFKQIVSCSFEFTDEDIKNELTTCVLKNPHRTIKLTYDYKSNVVECFCIGKDIDAVRKIVRLDEMYDFVKEYFPVIKRVVVVRKKVV